MSKEKWKEFFNLLYVGLACISVPTIQLPMLAWTYNRSVFIYTLIVQLFVTSGLIWIWIKAINGVLEDNNESTRL